MSSAAGLPLLAVHDLRIDFRSEPGRAPVRAVDRLSFALWRGEVLGMLGESGSGKSAAAASLARLLPRPPVCAVHGQVLLEGRDLLALPEAELRRVRGRRIAYVFQDPAAHLNPLLRVGEQVAEVLRWGLGLGRRAARLQAGVLFERVGLPRPGRLLDAYPHQLSGGMQQRVLLAAALAGSPDVLVADEPTSALDAPVQAQLLALLSTLQREQGLAVLLVSHDPEVIAACAARVAVVYAGRLMETGPAAELLARPSHPYTAGLLACLPTRHGPRRPLHPIPGGLPPLDPPPPGCRFAARCARADAACTAAEPELVARGPGRLVACHHPLGADPAPSPPGSDSDVCALPQPPAAGREPGR